MLFVELARIYCTKITFREETGLETEFKLWIVKVMLSIAMWS